MAIQKLPLSQRTGFPHSVRDLLFLFALVCLTFALAACSKPQLPRINPDDVIVAFGDSLTNGNGASRDESYPAVLSRLIGRTVINEGEPGETTADGLDRLPGVLASTRPQLVLLCLGGNDMLRRVPTATIESNLRKMIELIRSSGATVVLIGVPAPALISGPPSFYEELAEEFDLPYEDEAFNEVLKNPRLKADAIHANAEGYRIVAERVAELLRKAGAV